MIQLNDYLYSGYTVPQILHKYADDLYESAIQNHNEIDQVHCNFLTQITDVLEHTEFLTAQSERIREFYYRMAEEYPYLAFSFRGRIKSLIRAEGKFNGYIVEYVYDYYKKYRTFPQIPELKNKLSLLRDLLAYRIVISLPQSYLKHGADKRREELKLLYEIANQMVGFMEERGFTAELSGDESVSPQINDSIRPYFKDYIVNRKPFGYQSLHITFYDNQARCFIEMQLRTKEMDNYAEIGPANHLDYEKRQEAERLRRSAIPKGAYLYFDEAYERGCSLQQIDLAQLNVNMFSAMDHYLINDECGLYRGRLILPYIHLPKF
ncbi:MAG: guanosine polyphosphate pyrophosphohydrolase [Butyricicoccaceae bacterium]